MSGIGVVIAIIIVFLIYAAFTYNSFVSLRNRVKEAWSDVEVQMKRRYNLIPNLVETVKGYAAHESSTLQKVIEARNLAVSANSTDVTQVAETENQLSGALKSIFALSENYPNLKANESFIELQRELRDTEDKIQAARRFYNGNVMMLNTKVEGFPSNMVAALFHFEKEPYFELTELDEAAREPVQVKF